LSAHSPDADPAEKGSRTPYDGSKYEGELKDGKYHGQGALTFRDGRKYTGEFKKNKFDGQGTMNYLDGSKYEGQWKDGYKQGQGILTSSEGSKYVGEFRGGEFDGKGTLALSEYISAPFEGFKYEGEFKNGLYEGEGVLTFAEGIKYDGEWKAGEQHGSGTLTFPDGSKHTGEWKDGITHGLDTQAFLEASKHTKQFKNNDFNENNVPTQNENIGKDEKVVRMPLYLARSIFLRHGSHCFRTWFIDECDKNGMFGVTRGNLQLITKENPSSGSFLYKVGTKIYLEDAPYFKHISRRSTHRIVGPYAVIGSDFPGTSFKPFHLDGENVVVYEDPNPKLGPWLNKTNVQRQIDGVSVTINQMAGRFGYFPFRFRFVRCSDWSVVFVQCGKNCELCGGH
jgi:hypothetical protein